MKFSDLKVSLISQIAKVGKIPDFRVGARYSGQKISVIGFMGGGKYGTTEMAKACSEKLQAKVWRYKYCLPQFLLLTSTLILTVLEY